MATIFPPDPEINDEFQGYRWNGTAWTIIGPDLTGDVVHVDDVNTVTSTAILDGTIVNADINASAAIDKTKISGTAITAADTGTVTSTMIANGTIVDGDINASAAISQSKISELTSDLAAKAALAGATFTGNVSVVSPTSAGSNGVRNITMSTSAPTGGNDGDVWIVYS